MDTGPSYASFPERLFARVIDAVVLIPVGALARALPSLAPDLKFPLLLLSSLVGFFYFAFMESSRHQATVGKMLMKLKVTDLAGNRISFARSLCRGLGRVANVVTLGIGYLMVIWTGKKQALHDMLTDTVVWKGAPPGAFRLLMPRRFAFLAALLLSSQVWAKRTAPVPVAPVRADGVVYVAPHVMPDYFQTYGVWSCPLGCVEARDQKSKKLLWRIQVYRVVYDETLEGDVQDVFIRKLELKGQNLLVENESGEKFSVDLKTRAVTKR